MSLALNDLAQVRILCRTGTQVAYNIRHYRVSAATAPIPTEAQIAANMVSLWAVAYKAILGVGSEWRGVGVRRIHPAPPGLEQNDISVVGAGNAAGDNLPTQTCGIVTLTTAFAGRKYRGRMYLPFPVEGDNDGTGLPTAGYVTRAQAIGALMVQPVTTNAGGGSITLTPIIFHRSTTSTTDVVSYRVINRWGTQRRRDAYHAGDVPPF